MINNNNDALHTYSVVRSSFVALPIGPVVADPIAVPAPVASNLFTILSFYEQLREPKQAMRLTGSGHFSTIAYFRVE